MEPLKGPTEFQPVEVPAAVLTLSDCALDLMRMEGIIVMRFTQNGLGYVIDVPWDESQFRMMIASWSARLGKGDNGQGITSG